MSTGKKPTAEVVAAPVADPLVQPDPLDGVEEDYPSAAELAELLPKVELIEEDGEPLESDWHRLAMNLLLEVIAARFRGRTDYYAGGNMFIYFSEEQARARNFRGPDFFFVRGVSLMPLRRYWAVWLEGGRYPDVLIELLSPRTARVDRTTKKTVYETVFRTPEYFCYDPASQRLEGWRLVESRYQALTANEQGWLWSKELELWLGTWVGVFQGKEATWLRFYDAEGRLVLTGFEAEQLRANTEQQRAEAAEAALARLQARLAELERAIPPGETSNQGPAS